MAWPRGAVKEKIFEPWMDSLRAKGCKFEEDRRVTDLIYSEETGCVSEVVCGRATYKADAVIMAAAISSLQEIIKKRYAVSEFGSFLSLYGYLYDTLATSVKLFLSLKYRTYLPNLIRLRLKNKLVNKIWFFLLIKKNKIWFF